MATKQLYYAQQKQLLVSIPKKLCSIQFKKVQTNLNACILSNTTHAVLLEYNIVDVVQFKPKIPRRLKGVPHVQMYQHVLLVHVGTQNNKTLNFMSSIAATAWLTCEQLHSCHYLDQQPTNQSHLKIATHHLIIHKLEGYPPTSFHFLHT